MKKLYNINFDELALNLNNLQFYSLMDIISDKIPSKILYNLANNEDVMDLKGGLDVTKKKDLRVIQRIPQQENVTQVEPK